MSVPCLPPHGFTRTPCAARGGHNICKITYKNVLFLFNLLIFTFL